MSALAGLGLQPSAGIRPFLQAWKADVSPSHSGLTHYSRVGVAPNLHTTLASALCIAQPTLYAQCVNILCAVLRIQKHV